MRKPGAKHWNHNDPTACRNRPARTQTRPARGRHPRPTANATPHNPGHTRPRDNRQTHDTQNSPKQTDPAPTPPAQRAGAVNQCTRSKDPSTPLRFAQDDSGGLRCDVRLRRTAAALTAARPQTGQMQTGQMRTPDSQTGQIRPTPRTRRDPACDRERDARPEQPGGTTPQDDREQPAARRVTARAQMDEKPPQRPPHSLFVRAHSISPPAPRGRRGARRCPDGGWTGGRFCRRRPDRRARGPEGRCCARRGRR